MDITEAQLNEVTELAAVFMSVNEIAIIIGVDEREFIRAINISDTPAYQAYNRGKLKAKAELRKGQLQLAKQGSQPAAAMCEKFLKEQSQSETL